MSRSLRVLLFGYDRAGVSTLAGLRASGHEIVACYTHPSSREWIPSLSEACVAAGIPLTDSIPEPMAAQAYRDARPDLIVSAGYRRRISLPFLALPRWGAINAHLAPLPRYRGNAAIPWGILNGESAWGVTVHAMTHNYNDGGVLRRRSVCLGNDDNAYDLHVRASDAAAACLVDAVNEVAAGRGDLTAQDVREVRFYDSTVPFGGHIDWTRPAPQIAAFVRAMDFGRGRPDGSYEHLTPPAAASLAGKTIGVWRVRAGGTMSPYPPGTVTRTDGEVWVQTGRGHLVIDRICDADGRDVDAAHYFTERNVVAGEAFATTHVWRPASAPTLGYAA